METKAYLLLKQFCQKFNMIVFQKHFRFSQRPAIHLEFYQQKSTVLSRHLNLLIKPERKEAIPLQKLSERKSMTKAMLSDPDRFQDASVAQLL